MLSRRFFVLLLDSVQRVVMEERILPSLLQKCLLFCGKISGRVGAGAIIFLVTFKTISYKESEF